MIAATNDGLGNIRHKAGLGKLGQKTTLKFHLLRSNDSNDLSTGLSSMHVIQIVLTHSLSTFDM